MSCYSLSQVAEYEGHHYAIHVAGGDCHVPGCCMCGEYPCDPDAIDYTYKASQDAAAEPGEEPF
jgi:hypothetical protein